MQITAEISLEAPESRAQRLSVSARRLLGKLFVSRTTQTSFHLATKESNFGLTHCDIVKITAVHFFKGLFFNTSGSNGPI